MTAAFAIHALESRHIAEAGDAEMDALEAQMLAYNQEATRAFDALATSVAAGQQTALAVAHDAYSDFQKVHGEVLSLSRQNSNVRSLAMSLGQKRKVMAECLDRLSALQESVRIAGVGPTR